MNFAHKHIKISKDLSSWVLDFLAPKINEKKKTNNSLLELKMTGKCLKCLVQQYRSFKFKHFCPLSSHDGKEGLYVTLKRVILDTIGISQKFLDTSLVWQSFLTHFMPLISFDTPWKHQKARNFLMFSGGIKEVSGMKWFNASAYKICLCSGLAKSFLKTLLKSLLLFRLLP